MKELSHQTGEISFYFLLLNLFLGAGVSILPRRMKIFRFMLIHRRFLGIMTFIYLVAHVFFYIALESFEFVAFEQLWTKTYLTFGFSAWILMLVLALTSNDVSLKKLGARRWKQLHRIIYLASALISLHILFIEKTDLIKYSLILGTLWLVQGYRFFAWIKSFLVTGKSSSN